MAGRIRFFLAVTAAAMAAAGAPAYAALKLGDRAPDFTVQGSKAGSVFTFNLASQLKKGPVVLYFYPKAFTRGCTLEAHGFAENVDAFRKAGATVLGISGDDIATLQKFSREACRDKFAVLSASPAIIAAYNVSFGGQAALSDRTSYVIGRNQRIAYVFSNLDFKDHVAGTLAAVRSLKSGK